MIFVIILQDASRQSLKMEVLSVRYVIYNKDLSYIMIAVGVLSNISGMQPLKNVSKSVGTGLKYLCNVMMVTTKTKTDVPRIVPINCYTNVKKVLYQHLLFFQYAAM